MDEEDSGVADGGVDAGGLGGVPGRDRPVAVGEAAGHAAHASGQSVPGRHQPRLRLLHGHHHHTAAEGGAQHVGDQGLVADPASLHHPRHVRARVSLLSGLLREATVGVLLLRCAPRLLPRGWHADLVQQQGVQAASSSLHLERDATTRRAECASKWAAVHGEFTRKRGVLSCLASFSFMAAAEPPFDSLGSVITCLESSTRSLKTPVGLLLC